MSGMAQTGTGSGELTPLVLLTGDEQLLVDRAISRATAAARRIEGGRRTPDGVAAGLTVGSSPTWSRRACSPSLGWW